LTALGVVGLGAGMELIREVPDTALAPLFDGEPMVQSFVVAGRPGRVWITTAEALAVPRFGRVWVAGQLEALRAALGARAFNRALAAGIRVRAEAAELPLAA
jgi:hypothetical protein